MIGIDNDLLGVGARLRSDGFVHAADIIETAALRMANLKILLGTAYDIVDKELMPNVATMAIQDFGRLNHFLIDAGPIKKELEEDERRVNRPA